MDLGEFPSWHRRHPGQQAEARDAAHHVWAKGAGKAPFTCVGGVEEFLRLSRQVKPPRHPGRGMRCPRKRWRSFAASCVILG